MAGSAAAQGGTGTRILHLEVHINGIPVGYILRVTEAPDGRLSADGQELRNVGVAAVGSGEIWLDQIPGLEARLDEALQMLALQAAPPARAPRRISAAGRDRTDDTQATGGTGAVLNYGFWAEQGTATRDRFWAADLGVRLYAPLGTFAHGVLLTGDRSGRRHRRLDSAVSVPIPGFALDATVGDLFTRGPGWSRPVRLGGLQIRRNFDLRPDLVTQPLPEFSGSAALPSTVEVFFGTVRRYAADVPEGPFTLTDLPLAGRGGEAEVVIRDIAGRESRVALPFLVADDLLREGLLDFSLSLGRPRLGFGTEDDRYGKTIYASASLRYGLTDRLLVSGHLEGGGALRMGGLGAAFAIGTSGTAAFGLAASRSHWGDGALGEVSTDLSTGRARVALRLLRRSANFADIARDSAEDWQSGIAGDWSAGLRGLEQVTFSLPAANGWFSLLYARAERSGLPAETSVGLSHARRLGRGTLSLSIVAARGAQSETTAGLNLFLPLGPNRYGGVEARFGQRDRLAATISGTPMAEPGRWSWRAQLARDGGRPLLAGTADRTGRYGDLGLALRRDDTQTSTGLRLDGALAVTSGGISMSRPIDDAFAVVDVGAPGVPVFLEQRPVGVTGRSGRLLVPGLRGYQDSRLTIDPMALPVEAAVPMTGETVRPRRGSGVQLDFGIDVAPRAALVVLVDAAGQPVAAGETVVLEASGEDFPVGYDGLVYVQGLQHENLLRLTRPDGSGCTARFAYAPSDAGQTQLGPVPCL